MSDLGISGLANLGNTCFMNATLQCLSHTYELTGVLEKYKNNQLGSIIREWYELRKLMWSKNCIISPKRFLLAIQQTAIKVNMVLFTGYAQNDLPEFIMFMLNRIHEDIKREVNISIVGDVQNNTDMVAKKCYEMMRNIFAKEYSDIVSLFYGIHVSRIRDMQNNMLSHHPEPFFTLMLPIPKKINPTLKECFDIYCDTEILNKENQYFNDKSKKKIDAKKDITFFKLPDILILHLKRFDNDNRKNNTFVHYPLDYFDLSCYTMTQSLNRYSLYGVCNHMGTSRGGHYTAFVKANSGQWYHFNDTTSQKITVQQVCTPRAYCLFYRKEK